MKGFLLFIIAIVVLGCKNFETQKLSSDQIYQKELKQLDWTNLDSYPSFKACEQYTTKEDKKQCFEQLVAQHIFSILAEHEVVLKDSIHEKIKLLITITDQGHPIVDSIKMSANLEKKIPDFSAWIQQAVDSLPKIYPGEKRGIPVASQFILPLTIVSH